MQHKETRQRTAKWAEEVSASRTVQEQIDRLDTRLGKGQGAAKERKRLAKRLEEERKAH